MKRFALWVQKMFEGYYSFRLERRRKLFESLLNDKNSGVPQMLHNRAMEMAMRMVMNWLDQKRIRHCSACPSTETLEGVGGRFFCQGHKEEAQRVYGEYLETRKQKVNA